MPRRIVIDEAERRTPRESCCEEHAGHEDRKDLRLSDDLLGAAALPSADHTFRNSGAEPLEGTRAWIKGDTAYARYKLVAPWVLWLDSTVDKQKWWQQVVGPQGSRRRLLQVELQS